MEISRVEKDGKVYTIYKVTRREAQMAFVKHFFKELKPVKENSRFIYFEIKNSDQRKREGCQMEERKDTEVKSLTEVDYKAIGFPAWVLYDHPSDFPNYYIVRVHDAAKPDGEEATEFYIKRESLEECEENIKKAAKNLGIRPIFLKREESDDICIVGTWI